MAIPANPVFLMKSLRLFFIWLLFDYYHRVEDLKKNVILRESGQEELDRNSRDAMRRMLTSLHLIRASLMDDETVLAATVTGSQATLQEGTLYAA